MNKPDYLRLMDSEEIIARTISITESINVDLNFQDRIVGIENANGLVDFGVLRFVLMHTPWVPMPPAEIELPDGYEPCTTDSQRRRHIGENMQPTPRGRVGHTLCGHYGFDQTVANWRNKDGKSPWKLITELSLCNGCARTARRLFT